MKLLLVIDALGIAVGLLTKNWALAIAYLYALVTQFEVSRMKDN